MATLHGDAARPTRSLPGAAVQRQPGRAGRRWPTAATLPSWDDPYSKPCLPVRAGGGRAGAARAEHPHPLRSATHLLQIYVEPGDLDKTEHAMNSLIDIDRLGRESASASKCDLERFMIVAVSDFNMGAMENKGLNIFNTKYVLASAATSPPTSTSKTSTAWSPTSTSTTGPATASPAATGSSCQPEGRPDRLPRPGIRRRPGHSRADRRASAKYAACAPPSSRKTPARWPTRSARSSYRRDQQLLHRHGLRKGRRGHPHDPDPDRPRRLPQGHGRILPRATTARP